jgi:RNA polymerase sigma-70 factor (ECF subfamily)
VVEKLKPNYRQIVELYYIEEQSIEEIARMIELPIATVKTRLFRARDLLLTIVKRNKNI